MPRVIRLDSLEQFAAVNVLSDPGYVGGKYPIPNAVQVVLNWNLADGKQGHNVLGGIVQSFTTASAAVAEAIFAGIKGNGTFAPLMAQLATTASFAGVTIRDLRQIDQPTFTSTGASAPGTGTGIELPDEVALVMTLRTAKVGAGNRGRVYFCGFATSALGTGNVAAPAAVTAVTNFSSAIAAGMSAGGLTWGLIQRARAAYPAVGGGTHPERPAGIVPVTQGSARNNTWDSQRRRGLR